MDGECIYCGEVGNWCHCDEQEMEADSIKTFDKHISADVTRIVLGETADERRNRPRTGMAGPADDGVKDTDAIITALQARAAAAEAEAERLRRAIARLPDPRCGSKTGRLDYCVPVTLDVVLACHEAANGPLTPKPEAEVGG